ncbi:MAG: hypothetical protein P4L71_14160 [Acetobacteraceae bacterium]|nr:hypothetical protein [Acetobacteraceae bacterium]
MTERDKGEEVTVTHTAGWQLTLSGISMILVIGGALVTFYVQTVSTAASVAQLLADVQAMKSQLSGQTDRLAEIGTANARIETSLTEVETQFCSSDIIRNLMHANDMRTEAMLWHKVFESDLPTNNAYYPVVCNRATSPNGK